ncbi:MAG: hypothetical protein KKD05_00395 [Candidatus Omnitrophica bacterium]|nr:hypothetical protein [Candidatus Omnitrophota bacterium]
MKKQIKFKAIFLLLVIIIMNLMPLRGNLFIENAFAQLIIKNDESSEVFVYTSDERRDPFISLITKSGDYKDNVPSTKEEMLDLIKLIKVDGILWDSEMPLVMINKEIHKIGDIINNLIIKKITTESVTFAYSDLTHTITIIEKKDF